MEIIDKKKFAKARLDEHVETFVVYVTFLLTMAIHPARKAQMALLVANEIKISTKYSDFSDVFLGKKTLILLDKIKLNQYAIELQEGQQLSYEPIYRLGLIELEMLKTYIETNLANDFIWHSKLPASAPMLFIKKPNGSLCLHVDY